MSFFRLTEPSTSTVYGYGTLSACMLTLAMPGHFGWWPLLFAALVPLLFLCLYLPPRTCAAAGFFSAFLYHLGLLYWIVIVLHRYGGLPVWSAVIALVLLALYMSCFTGLFCYLLSCLAGRSWQRERSIVPLVWSAPLLWTAIEYLRSVLFSGFPWMDLGYGLFSQPRMIQVADLGGHYAVGFSLVLCNALIVAIVDRQRSGVRWNVRMERRLLLFAVGFLVFMGGYSFLRYDIVTCSLDKGLTAHIAVVQGNIDQGLKWSADRKEKTIRSYIELSETVLKNRDTELVIWPETAVPFYLQQDPLAMKPAGFVRRNNVWLMTGTPAYSITGVHENGSRDVDYYNAAVLIDASARVVGQYNKQHLVPFGEYVPLKQYLPFLAPLVEAAGDFTAGTSSEPLTMGRIRMGVLICYESIFPEIAQQAVASGANLLVNLTNDAWYGRSSAPYQSMAMAVFRAVETKRSLVRAANTGISGFVDPVGNVYEETELFEPAAVSAQVPLLEKETVFTRSGHLFGLCCLCAVAAILLFQRPFLRK